jgi:osmotically-inducible protein OsmY
MDNGVATLSGYVWSTDAIYRARKIASEVPGVTRVVTSQLELERNGRNNGVTR